MRVAPVTMDNAEWIFARAYLKAKGRQRRKIADAYLVYMEAKTDYWERQSVALLGREIPQVLLVHANRLNADHFERVAAMLARRGYRFVPLEDALADEAYASPDRFTGAAGISWLHRWALTRGGGSLLVPDEPGHRAGSWRRRGWKGSSPPPLYSRARCPHGPQRKCRRDARPRSRRRPRGAGGAGLRPDRGVLLHRLRRPALRVGEPARAGRPHAGERPLGLHHRSRPANWHPLTWLSHMLDGELFGARRPARHHLTNVAAARRCNGCAAVPAAAAASRAAPGRSAVVAGLFAVHPLHVESVAWIAERKDVLSRPSSSSSRSAPTAGTRSAGRARGGTRWSPALRAWA